MENNAISNNNTHNKALTSTTIEFSLIMRSATVPNIENCASFFPESVRTTLRLLIFADSLTFAISDFFLRGCVLAGVATKREYIRETIEERREEESRVE